MAGKEVVIVEEEYDSDENCPESHVGLLEELTNLDEITQVIPKPVLVEEMIGPRGVGPENQTVQVEEMTDKGVSSQVAPLPKAGKGKKPNHSK